MNSLSSFCIFSSSFSSCGDDGDVTPHDGGQQTTATPGESEGVTTMVE